MNIPKWKRRLRYWFQQGQRRRQLQDEMEFHLESLAQNLMDQGAPEEEARAAARRKFGNVIQKQEDSRGAWIAGWISDAGQDLKHTLRTFLRDPAFAIFAILIVGLGIGASSTIFSLINTLLLRPLPFQDSGRLVWVKNQKSVPDGATQVGHLVDLRAHNQSFSDLAAYYLFAQAGDSKLTGEGEPERLNGLRVTQNFFPLLGVQPALGRYFSADESKARWDSPQVVLLSYGLWKRRFGSDPGIAGRKLVLNESPVTVAGVLPESFDFAAVFSPASRVDLFYPFPLTDEADRRGNTLAVIGRLKAGVGLDRAQAELTILGRQLSEQHRQERNSVEPHLSSLKEHVSGPLRRALLVLAGAIAVVMLIVCANLSNLLLARMAARQKEMAVRAALGAGRQRLIRQMLTESLTLSSCGAICGVILAILGTRALAHLDAVSLPLLSSVQVDGVALGFTLLAAILTGLLFGLTPALQAPSARVSDALKDGVRGSSGGQGWIRNALVVSEVAFACVLLVGTGLLVRSFLHLLDVNLGFQPERAAAMRIDPGGANSATQDKRNAYFSEALRLARSIPGVQAAGLTDVLPLGGDRSWGIAGKGQVYSEDQHPEAFVRIVSEGYLKAMGIPLREGRDFTERDTPASEPVIIINESLARRLWPGQNPVGQMVTQDGGRRVVGVVSNVRHQALEEDSGNEMYLPVRQTNDYSSVDLVVRTALPPAGLAAAIRGTLKPLNPDLPGNDFRTMQEFVDKAVSPRRLIVILLGGFSAFALILASLGIYAVVAYSVRLRTQELGIRMALGASSAGLQIQIILQTLRLVAAGMLVGAIGAWVLARALSSLLFGVTSTDPVTFLGMLITLTVVAALAGYLPARRAARIDPISALRAN